MCSRAHSLEKKIDDELDLEEKLEDATSQVTSLRVRCLCSVGKVQRAYVLQFSSVGLGSIGVDRPRWRHCSVRLTIT